MAIDLNQVIRDIGGWDIVKKKENDWREKEEQELQNQQQHQSNCDEGELDELHF